MSCPDCFRGGQAVGDPQGRMENIAGVSTYVAGTPSSTTSQSTIIYYTDAFGLKLVNNKLLADAYASATGFRVLVPDIIPGGPMEASLLGTMDKAMASVALFDIWGQLVRAANIFIGLTKAIPFMLRASPSSNASFKASLEYARKLKADLPPGAKLGAAGFCWGGYQSINLCAQPAVEGGSERLIDASFSAHVSQVNAPDQMVDAVLKFKSAVTIAHGRKDFALATEKVEQTEAVLKQKAGDGDGENGFNWEVRYYDVGHGFAVRAKPGDQVEADAADDAKAQAIDWFKKWL